MILKEEYIYLYITHQELIYFMACILVSSQELHHLENAPNLGDKMALNCKGFYRSYTNI
jgi:hypothetical protein